MAGGLGGLVVSLGLNSVDYTTGLTKAENDARKFAQSFSNNVAAGIIKAEIALRAFAEVAKVAFTAIPDLIEQAGHFQDLAEKSGIGAQSLASFAVAAKVAGTSIDDVSTFSIRLSKNLTSVDDESSKTAAALKALGIPIKEFRSLNPEQQFERLAKALAQFSDIGAGKAAALESIAKGGAQLLPFLKELEEGTGRVNILTAEQIKRADEFSDAMKRSGAILNTYSQALAIEFAPAITAFKNSISIVIAEMLGLNAQAGQLPTEQVRNFADNSAIALAHLADVVRGVGVSWRIMQEIINRTGFGVEPKSLSTLKADLDAILNETRFVTRVRQEIAQQRAMERALSVGPPAPDRPQLAPPRTTTRVRAGADRISEAERFLESLKRQLEATEKLTAEEKALAAIQSGRLKGLTPDIESRILSTAREIDNIKALEEAHRALEKALQEEARAAAEAQRERDQATKAAKESAGRAEEANEALRDEIAIMLGGDAARKALEKDHLAIAIAKKKDFLATRELKGASEDEIKAINAEIAALEERSQLLVGRDIAEQLKKDAEQLQAFKNIFADTFADAFSSFIDGSKSASDAFKSFAKSVEQQITRLAAQNIADKIFGGNSGGGGFDFSKIIAALFGGLGGGAGGIGGGAFIPPGGGLAGGTPSWRGGLTVVGERGPEVVNLPRGASVTSNRDSQKLFGPTMNFSINVLPGASTQTAAQAASQTGIAVRRAMARNT